MIKKSLLILLITLLFWSCDTPKNYAKLSGKVDNILGENITLSNLSGYSKTIALNKDGTFSDTLHVKNEKDLYSLNLKKPIHILIKNDDNIHVTVNNNKIDTSIEFSGKGSEINSYFIARLKARKEINLDEVFLLNQEDFDRKATEITTRFIQLLDKHQIKDSVFSSKELLRINNHFLGLKNQYQRIHTPLEGKIAPIFNDYQHAIRGVTSLYDLKGKYVYISMWKTDSNASLAEVSTINSLIEEYKGKNIHFVSISKDTNKEKWLEMVKNKKMKGIQLIVKEGDTFSRNFSIHTVPRYILIDPKGMVVNANMTKPSDPKTKKLLKNLIK